MSISTNTRPAFTILDLVACIGLAAVVSAVGVPAVRTATSDNALQRCRYNLRTIGQAGSMYQEDFLGQMWGLSWNGSMVDPLQGFVYGGDRVAQSYQATYIARRLAGLSVDQTPVPSAGFGWTFWVPGVLFSHLALADYAGLSLPDSTLVCPLDARRMAFVRGDVSQFPQSSGDGASTVWQWLVTSSYRADVYRWSPSRQEFLVVNGMARASLMIAAHASDERLIGIDPPVPELTLANSLRPRQAADVRFPSAKVSLADTYSRHNGTPRYYAYSDAVQDLQFYDGSVRTYRTDSTNPGWQPNSTSSRGSMRTRFSHTKFADFWGGLDGGAQSTRFSAGWYFWTRGGLFGWDVPRMSSMQGKPPSSLVIENELDTSATTGRW